MKKLFYGVAAAAAILLAGCGQKGANAPAKSGKPAVTAASVYKKAEKATKEIKNSTIDMEMNVDTGDEKMSVQFTGKQAIKPEIQVMGTYKIGVDSDKQSIEMYATTDSMYVKAGNQWIDASEKMGAGGDLAKQISKGAYSSVSSSLMKKAKLAKKDGMYEITVKMTDKEAKTFAKTMFGNSGIDGIVDALDDVDAIRVTIVTTYDAKTYLPKESKAKVEIEDLGDLVKETTTTTYDAYNESPITKPADLPAAK